MAGIHRWHALCMTRSANAIWRTRSDRKSMLPPLGVPLKNPDAGDVMWLISTPEELDEGLLRVRLKLPPRCHWAPPHFHTDTDERVRVETGTVRFRLGRTTHWLTRDSGWLQVPRRTVHAFSNVANEPAVLIGEMHPCHQAALGIVATYGLARDGKLGKSNLPKNPLDAILILHLLRAYSPLAPLRLQEWAFGKLVPLARRLHPDPDYVHYMDALPEEVS